MHLRTTPGARLRRIFFAGLILMAPAAALPLPPGFRLEALGEAQPIAAPAAGALALHFFDAASAVAVPAHAAEWNKRAPEVAGVRHAYVFVGDGAPPEGVAPLYRDRDGSAAKSLGVAAPGLAVLAADGSEILKYAGRSMAEFPSFKTFAAAVRTKTAVKTGEYNLPADRIALKGYDPVSYFSDTPAKGGGLVSEYRGVVYRFASEENRRKFAAEPEKYAPTYGGWCATAMVEGDKVDIDPENFKVTGGRLFLFYKGWLGDAKKEWVKDEPGKAAAADAQWKRIGGE